MTIPVCGVHDDAMNGQRIEEWWVARLEVAIDDREETR
jgi:hypothetical protein